MSHSHSHSRVSAGVSAGRLFTTMALNFAITIAEVIGGLFSGSLSLISDALHNLSDGVAIIISYIAIRLNQRPKSPQFTFGLKRAEILAATVNASTLIVICFFLFKEAYGRLVSPSHIEGGMMAAVAGIGLLANVAGTLLLRPGARDSMNIRAAYLHLFSDALSSVAVLLGGLAIYFYKIYWLDPVLTILISLYVLRESYLIVKEAVNVILMGTPAHLSLRAIQKELEALPGVRNIHHVHAWRLDEHDVHFEAHVEVEDMRVSQTSELLKQMEELLREKFGISHVTLQFESDICKEKELV